TAHDAVLGCPHVWRAARGGISLRARMDGAWRPPGATGSRCAQVAGDLGDCRRTRRREGAAHPPIAPGLRGDAIGALVDVAAHERGRLLWRVHRGTGGGRDLLLAASPHAVLARVG